MANLFPPSPLSPAEPRPKEASGEPLNESQRAAVRHGEGPLLVVAGAGTGKTRVITERIRHLLESDPDLPGEAILGLTFTDKAAAEMKRRVARSVGERGRAVFVGTFHAFCSSLLLERNPHLETLEKEDHWILLRRNLRLLGLERYRRLAEPGQFLGDFVAFFSRCQDELVTPDRYENWVASLAERYAAERGALAEDERKLREEEIARQREVARAYRASDTLLRETNRLTFGMQLLDAVRALDDDAALLARLRARYRYILVDEFQDTNVAQIELLWRLGGDRRNIVAVGDDAQAIYRFRGASFGSFIIFLERFAGVPRGQSHAAERFVRHLTDNYRSTGKILRVAGRVVSFVEKSPLLPKTELVAHKAEGEKVRICEFGSAAEEAAWIAADIDRLHAAGAPWRRFAVLYRNHVHRNATVEALERRGVPFVVRNLTILDHPLVRDVLAYLRLIVKPRDNVACARVLAAPAWGLEAADLVRLCERTGRTEPTLWDVLQAAQGELPFSGGESARARAEVLVKGIAELRRRAQRAPAADVFAALTEWLALPQAVSPDERRYIDRLAQFLREWQKKSATSRLAEFVEYLDYFAQAGGQVNLEQEADDAVQLMTVHAAKGLEFDNVYVLRLTQGAFPNRERTAVLEFPEELMQEEVPRGNFHTQEERRLFYVALTRARERLTLTTVMHKRSKPSVFLDDILSAPALAKQNVRQIAPDAERTAAPAAGPGAQRRDAAPEIEPLFRALADEPASFVEATPESRLRSRIGAWARAYRPPVFEPLKLSASKIEEYRGCPQCYLFSKVWGIREGPRASTTFGNVMHTTIKQFVAALRKGQRLPFDEVETIFRREWTSAGFEDSYQEECYLSDGIEQLRAFHARCLAEPFDVLAQERFFTLEEENGVQVTGRMDQINRVPPDAVEIVDYKTGRPKKQSAADKDLQLGIYALAAREALDLEAVRLVYHSLQNNERLFGERSEKQLNEVRGVIQEVAADIRAREFPANPGFRCKTCEFRFICPAQESAHGRAAECAPDAPVPPATSGVSGPKAAEPDASW